MCGLCGVLSSTLNQLEVESFQDLMSVSTLRGYYGSGIVAVPTDHSKDIQIIRHGDLTAAELAHSPEFFGLTATETLSMLMGHARHPTTGGTEIEDTHPHCEGDIIGMHNGTLTNVCRRHVGKKDNDSRMLFKSIDLLGIDETIEKSKGAYALTYIHKALGTLYFLRNKERPMFWAKVEGVRTLYWASEAGFLNLVLGRNYSHQKVTIYTAQPDRLVSFPIRPIGDIRYLASRALTQGKPTSVPAIVNTVPESNITHLPVPVGHRTETDGKQTTMYKTTDNCFWDYMDLRDILNTGCCYCGQGATMMDYAKKRIYWTGKDEFVCKQCADHDQFAKDYISSNGLLM